MIGLILCGILCLFRQKTCNDELKKLNNTRYLTMMTLIIQFMVFIGYYIHEPFIHETFWNIWIPTWTLAFGILSKNIASLHVDTQSLFVTQYNRNKRVTEALSQSHVPYDRYHYLNDNEIIGSIDSNNTDDSVSSTHITDELTKLPKYMRSLSVFVDNWEGKYKKRFFKFVWGLWFLCSLWNWMGSLFGWVLNMQIMQTISYAMWKVNALIMLIGCIIILFIIQKRGNVILLDKNDDYFKNKKTTRGLLIGLKKIKYLIICQLILGCVLLLAIIYEFSLLHAVLVGHVVSNVYAQSTLMSILVYFPLYTMVSVVLVVYSWIPKDDWSYEANQSGDQLPWE